jgi:hypothetical protein
MRNSAILTVCLAVCLAFLPACSSGSDPSDPEEGEESELQVISVAVGAEVTLELGDYLCNRGLDRACLGGRPTFLRDVSLTGSGPFELVGSELTENQARHDAIMVTVRALEPGETTLVVEFDSRRDGSLRTEFVLRALEVTHVDAHVRCQSEVADRESYPVTTGSDFIVVMTAMADETPLAHGTLPLMRGADAFAFHGVSLASEHAVTAPDEPGRYPWSFIGEQSTKMDFVVYDPADLVLRITREEESGVTVGRVVDDEPICVHQGEVRAYISVGEGSCLPAVNGFEFPDGIPVDLGEGDARIELTGRGECTVSAEMDGVGAFDLKLRVDNPPAAPEVPEHGDPIGVEALEVGGRLDRRESCIRVTNLTDGTCEIINVNGLLVPEPDCLMEWDWEIEHHDGTGSDSTGQIEDEPVGVGLFTELQIGIRYKLLIVPFMSYPPNSLVHVITPDSGLVLDSLGCVRASYEVLSVRAEEAGEYELSFTADNAYDAGEFAVSVLDIDSIRFTEDDDEVLRVPEGTRVAYFVGSEIRTAQTYLDASGTPLRGVAPTTIASDSDDAEASIQGPRLFTGTRPHLITVSSEATPLIQLIDVVDETAIAGIGGFSPEEGRPGEEICITPHPTGENGTRIHGQSPVRPQVTLVGDALVVQTRFLVPGELCLVGFATGETTVGLGWGGAEAEQAWQVP